jgi:diadenosine tetraphosphate (Ap4A) HIT family hydrolase
MNATMEKFGYPDSIVCGFSHWQLLMRPQQVTLGALVLAASSEARSFGTLPAEAFTELKTVTMKIEEGLRNFRVFDKINYLMLMMLDPHVHFHVLPRYAKSQMFANVEFADTGWPGPAELKSFATLTDVVRQELLKAMRSAFGQSEA